MSLIRFMLGELKGASELRKLGYSFKGSSRYMWISCPDCGKERWVSARPSRFRISQDNPFLRCVSCSSKHNRCIGAPIEPGDKNPNWKGGRHLDSKGYLKVWLSPDDFFYPMAQHDGYVLEHRLVMAKHLGRCLQCWEIVHHKGIRYAAIENKSDNLLDNLEVSTNGSHIREAQKGYRDGYSKGIIDGHDKAIKDLQSRVTLLEAENILLRMQLAGGGVPFQT